MDFIDTQIGARTRLVRRMGMPTYYDHECGKPDNVSEGHVPTMPQPESDRFRSGYEFESATPADEPNQIIDPPNPTA